ncbi:PRD domain-containing protein [Anaerobacillus alkaliphilus]|uniref:PRD domain-containing protein n=1 Tax=Anaerobacillus alkaliphilus TaxID=1548597 RepID=A0A4Q0VNY7_9BACI|nr:PRD domain-containing protein [Anaerobacillus alkaliphilus]RXI96590.1 PRD domain-containing protein [Anaerobacillus alkaliphilus]
MRIDRILNNNAVVILDGSKEKIVMGSGIAFQKRKNDIIPKHKVEKVFILSGQSSEKFQQLLATLPEKHIELAEKVIDYAEGYLQEPLHDHIHIALTDHLSFALERVEQGFTIQNKLTNEIKLLYKKEFEIGQWAKSEIKNELGLDIPDDEVAHIALHIHTAKIGGKSMGETIQKAEVLSDFVSKVEEKLNTKIDEASIAYQRLVTHVRFALARVEEAIPFEPIDPDMAKFIQEKYGTAYQYSEEILEFIKNEYGLEFPPSEIAYITLHLQRLL